jgi:hypothetical protein
LLNTKSVTYRNYDKKKKWYTVYTHGNVSSQAVIQTASALAANISGARSHNTSVDI